jgi:magnesium-transporting ATPase (P-type)
MSFVRASIDPTGGMTDGKKKAEAETTAAGKLFEALPKNFNLFVVLVVVAIPEGLPLVIQISLAFSVMRMFK